MNPWYFVPAVQMYFTGLLDDPHPEWQYLIYGVFLVGDLPRHRPTLERRRSRPVGRSRSSRLVLESRVAEEVLADRY